MIKHYFFLLMLLGVLSSARAQTQTFTATGANQSYTITSDGTVTITATGGSGGTTFGGSPGGSGARISATFTVKNGDKLIIVAGSDGNSGGGGGGSAVLLQRTDVPNNILLVAGAGGGGASVVTTPSQGAGGSSALTDPGGGAGTAGSGGGGFGSDGAGFFGGKMGTLQGGGNPGRPGTTGFGFGGGGGYNADGTSARGGGGYRGGGGAFVDNGGGGGTSYISSGYDVSGIQTQDGVTGGGTNMSGSVVINFVAFKPALGTPTATNTTCNSGTDGSITATATGGSGMLTFSLSPGNKPSNTSGNFTDLAAGTYTLTVKDANGKSDSKQVTVGQPTAVSFTTTVINVSCNGGDDGSIKVMASGGNTDPSRYSYSDDGGQYYQPPSTFNGRKAGTYAIKVKDSRNCESQTQSVTIAEPAPISFTTTAVMPKCFGGSDGSITVSASGGTPGYTYSINGGEFGTSPTFTGLSAGEYIIRVRDANDCEIAPQTATVTQPTAVSVMTGPDKSVIRGFGGPNSTCTDLSANASGGTPGSNPDYTYVWMPGGQTGPQITVCPLETTTYTMTATDANGCMATATQTVNVQDVRCGPKLDKVSICYYGVPQCVSEKIAERYLKLGTTLGACGSTNNNNKRIGVEESSELPLQLTLRAYPNPVVDAVTVEVLSRVAGEVSFEILDATGRARQSRRDKLAEGLNQIEFKLGALPTGIYLIRAVDALGQQGVVRVSKQ